MPPSWLAVDRESVPQGRGRSGLSACSQEVGTIAFELGCELLYDDPLKLDSGEFLIALVGPPLGGYSVPSRCRLMRSGGLQETGCALGHNEPIPVHPGCENRGCSGR